jgi:hypothetical protein
VLNPIFGSILIKRNLLDTAIVGVVIQAEKDAETSSGKNCMRRLDGNIKLGHLFHATGQPVRGQELLYGEM